MAAHVRFKSLYISLPSSAKQHREMSKFYLFSPENANDSG